MNVTRRTVLAGTAVLGFGALAWSTRPLWSAAGQDGSRTLAIPPLLEGAEDRPVTLRAQPGETEFFNGARSATFGYNGSYLGPTLRVRRGQRIPVSVVNALAEPTTLHWHGLLVPGPLDGGPHQTIAPGATWQPVLPVDQPAATLIYHSHVHGRTAEQVYAGLLGLLIISDDEERSLGLPSEYGVDDIPLILQDRHFQDGMLVLPTGMMTLMNGRRGDTILVNGTPGPVAPVPGRLVRLRLANGSNARIYHLGFDDNRTFHWIASEGGLLEHAVALRSISLAPGERAEVLVDFSNGEPVSLRSGPDVNMPMMGMMARSGGGRAPQTIVRFEPQSSTARAIRVPDRLARRQVLEIPSGARRRRLTLTMGMAMMGGAMMGRGVRGGMGGMGSGAPFGINGRAFDMERIDQEVRLGDAEIWEVSGEMMAHPFHMHGVHFEVLRRGGAVAGVRDQGLRDTVLVEEPVELLVRFRHPSGGSPFMHHCHILEHEDNGMMGQFTVS